MTAMKHDHTSHPLHPDLDAVLDGVPLQEAERLRAVWDLVGHEEPTGFPGPAAVHAAHQRLAARLDAEAPRRDLARNGSRVDHRPRARGFERRQILRWSTAAVAALLAIGALAWFFGMDSVTQQAPLGERLAVTLPDGSRVELNSGSSLHYTRRFGDERAVRLVGEAYFAVRKDTRPFVVETFNAHVQVLGTRFAVRAWPQHAEQGTTVALETGRVALAPAGHRERAAAMAPGETRRVTGGAVEADAWSPMSVAEATAWRHGDLVFKDQSLDVILADVERRFAIELQLVPSSLALTRLNITLRQPASAEAVVNDLAMALGLRYRETSTGYALYADVPNV